MEEAQNPLRMVLSDVRVACRAITSIAFAVMGRAQGVERVEYDRPPVVTGESLRRSFRRKRYKGEQTKTHGYEQRSKSFHGELLFRFRFLKNRPHYSKEAIKTI